MDTTIGAPFSMGINYWPRRKAMGWWRDFDAAEVRAEFAVIRDVGLSLVRIFLLWEDWQPAPDRVDEAALANLVTVADIAAALGLQLNVTFFTGHMSGPNWAPAWLLDSRLPLQAAGPAVRQVVSGGRVRNHGYRNPFTDPTALRAAQLLLRTVVERLRGHPAVAIWNLGNEPDLFAWPPDRATGRSWVQQMVDLIRTLDPATPVTCGLHVKSLVEDNHLRVPDVFGSTDLAVMHGYPMYAGWSAGPLDPDFVPFLCALTSALCGKPTLAEEFGACTAPPGAPSITWAWTAYGQPRRQFMASEEAYAAYLAAVLPRLQAAGASGAMLWCFADYDPALYEQPPCDEAHHERFFGLVRPDGSLKPHAAVLREFANRQPRIAAATRAVSLDVTPETYYQAPLDHARRLYGAYRAMG